VANETRPVPRADEVLSRIVIGLAALAAGIIFWLDRLGQLNARDYFIFWPVILIAFGVTNAIRRHWIAAVILFVLGFSLMPAIPFLPHVRLSFLFAISPLLLSVAGAALVLQAVRPATTAPTTFRAIAVMGGNQRTIGSSAPEEVPHGEVVVAMGGCEIDLTRSNAREVVIDLLVFWGGVEIKV